MATTQDIRSRKAEIKARGFNADYAVGTAVRYRERLQRVIGVLRFRRQEQVNFRETRTRSEAFVHLGDAAIFVECVGDFVPLDHCEVISPLATEPVF